MDLIIGGAYQGKRAYAMRKYGLTEEDCFDLSAGLPDRPYRCLYSFEALTKRAAEWGLPFERFMEEFSAIAEDSVVIACEIGSGVVPMDADARLWREYHGMALSLTAERAERVVRIFCGLEEVLK